MKTTHKHKELILDDLITSISEDVRKTRDQSEGKGVGRRNGAEIGEQFRLEAQVELLRELRQFISKTPSVA